MLAGTCFGVAVSTHLLVSGTLGKTYRAYIVQSGSMAPALPVGSVVITKSEPDYGKGDIVTFTQNSSQTTHRIASVEFDQGQPVFTTKGDANEEADNVKIKKDQIIGRSFFVVPYVGYLADFVRTPKGFVLFVVIPASIIIYEELKSVLAELKRVLFKKGIPGGSTTKAALFVPIVGVAFLFLSVTDSFFSDNEGSVANILGASATFGTPPGTPSPTPSPTPTGSPTPAPSLVINEFMSQPTGGEFDWVEIYNTTDQPISLTGWKLDEVDQDPKALDSLGSIPALGLVVYEYTTNAWLDNDGDTIDLINPANQIVDFQIYSDSTPGVSRGSATDGTGIFFVCLETSKGLSNNGVCQL